MARQLNIILVPHTHWDREWYQTYQQFRIRLVQTVDKLLDILERDPGFTYFMLDGQTIVLDDYLEVEPEQEERLRQHIRAGRVLVGPWYLQPDEFLVSGEALIRNLQFGLRRAAEFGGAMRVGYLPDCFGHIAQMPQILRGFGIDNAVFWRGVGAEAKNSEFYWAAPDGTKVLVIHLADPFGYSNARMMPLNPREFVTRLEMLTASILARATSDTLLFMNGSDHLEPQEGLPAVIEAANAILQSLEGNPLQERLLAQLVSAGIATTEQDGQGYDSIHVQIGTLPHYIEAVRRSNPDGNFQTLRGEMRSSQYAPLLPAVLSSRIWIKQQNTATEQLLERWVEPLTAWAALLGARYPAGLVRLAWKYLLQNHPHDSICGCSLDQVHVENRVRFAQSQQIGESVLAQAMQFIADKSDTRAPFVTAQRGHEPVPIVVFNPSPAQNSALAQAVVQLEGSLHNAVLVDERGVSMPYRIIERWSQERGSMEFPRETVQSMLAFIGYSEPGSFIEMAHGALNMALGESEGSNVITHVHIDTDQQAHPGVARIELLIAPAGRVPVNEAELASFEPQMLALLEREDIETLHISVIDQLRELLEFVATDLPAYGLKTCWLYPRGFARDEADAPAAPASSASLTAPAPNAIENEWFRVEASLQDGTLTVTDKQTGAVYAGLNRFVDGGDIGDLYTYCPPQEDRLISQPTAPPHIELVSEGPTRAALRISGRWELPGSCSESRGGRSEKPIACAITSEVTLIPDTRRIDIRTSIDNAAKDHRLRVIFPVPFSVEQVAAEGTFEVCSRPIASAHPADTTGWAETPVNTFPQKRFVDISNGAIGLGVLNRGLPEYEILQGGPGVPEGGMAVAVTLLRCVEWLSRGDLTTRRGLAGPMEHTPEAQCLGQHVFEYALVPHKGDWQADNALVLREAQAFNTTVRALTVSLHEGQQPATARLVSVEPPELVVSAIKRSNDGQGLVVRVYNPLTRSLEATVKPGPLPGANGDTEKERVAFTHAFMANLQEELQQPLPWQNGDQEETVHVSIRPGEIKTLLFR
ncbi:MAG TPA: glycoside hydrolase family 38 C-terminal domain-containing protein [Ktedonobacteraceae bacterium]|nr:glycoside hydrolase family 38 C-terminal domain-containing protein [Ktedonobacteraceae bacterium]